MISMIQNRIEKKISKKSKNSFPYSSLKRQHLGIFYTVVYVKFFFGYIGFEDEIRFFMIRYYEVDEKSICSITCAILEYIAFYEASGACSQKARETQKGIHYRDNNNKDAIFILFNFLVYCLRSTNQISLCTVSIKDVKNVSKGAAA